MPKIVVIANDLSKDLAEGLESLGHVFRGAGSAFTSCHAQLLEERDVDLLITNLPASRSMGMEYTASIQTLRNTVQELRIPVIVHTGMSMQQSWLIGSLPVFLHFKELRNSDASVLATARAIAKIWFPMGPDERKEFMDETLGLYYEEARRTDTPFTDEDCILLERFQVVPPDEIAEMRAMHASLQPLSSPVRSAADPSLSFG